MRKQTTMGVPIPVPKLPEGTYRCTVCGEVAGAIEVSYDPRYGKGRCLTCRKRVIVKRE